MTLTKRKRTILGYSVLILAGIFLLLVFTDGKTNQHIKLSPLMPASPAKPQVDVPNLPAESPQLAKRQQQTPTIDAWTIQLASLRDEKNAIKLRYRLQHHGFAAYIDSSKGKSGEIIYRVMVGPVIKRAKAELLSKNIAAQFKLQGMVRKFMAG